MKITIIIPILNEASTIGKLLSHLETGCDAQNIEEILVIDGGSTDESQAIAQEYEQVRLLTAPKGRAKQMNLGAKNAKGEILYFVHSDSLPPKKFDHDIIAAVRNHNIAGCFRMRFDRWHWWLITISWFTRFNSPICRGGDQSLFITKTLFDTLGGYDETFIIYEDNNFTQKLYAMNTFTVLQKTIVSSARMYTIHGIWKLQYHFFRIHLLHWSGASPEQLYQYYRKHIA